MSNLEIAGFLVALVLAAAVAWYGAKALFLRRIRALLDAADRVRGGDFSVRVHLPPGKGELNRLAAAFDEMAEALQQRDAELRHAVLELHSQATTDPLTRLSNRRHLSDLLPRELIRARRKDGKVAVLMIDLDFFKKINDTFGHNAGDLVLSEVGQLLRAGIRGSDIACRYGGEEISLVMPDTALKVATERAESIRKKIKNLQITHEGQVIGPITVSIGVAIFPDHAEDPDTLLRVADAALYEAKRDGRDRIAVGKRIDTLAV
ncbi:MAG TPA: GGDEF domain-containing protein [Burkholderiales bacterium]|nr:GGDEF domain-containing protein [Burkholderiales bacterium]